MKEKELENLAIAYLLACEFDYCPEDLDEAKEFDDRATQEILDKYSGNRPDEISGMLIKLILKKQ